MEDDYATCVDLQAEPLAADESSEDVDGDTALPEAPYENRNNVIRIIPDSDSEPPESVAAATAQAAATLIETAGVRRSACTVCVVTEQIGAQREEDLTAQIAQAWTGGRSPSPSAPKPPVYRHGWRPHSEHG